MVGIVESERSRRDDALEENGVVGVDETSSLLSDGVERRAVDDCSGWSRGGEEDLVDEGGRGKIGVLGDEQSDDAGDEGRLKRGRGKGKRGQLRARARASV